MAAVPGDELVRVAAADWMLGLSVCYDLRFPGLYQALSSAAAGTAKTRTVDEGAPARGADILLVPSAFTLKTGEPHWEVLLRARAIETQSYVIAAAQSGSHNEKRTSYGHTMVIDPWGAIGEWGYRSGVCVTVRA
jgi:predicted amidohydrolase